MTQKLSQKAVLIDMLILKDTATFRIYLEKYFINFKVSFHTTNNIKINYLI